eukprot:TRINITY_DN10264_c0_g1_i3.p1 TRINITY_DN10264_c0_g1~~TRINITY_DN10264_c0_g1_i3.p1  ORF type:complete len:195 (-),score=54.39 TRINITY_DN10264_c0_g1_i3:348-932(-)
MMSMAMVTVLAALLIPATLGFFDPRALVTGSGAEIDPNLPEEVRERQAAFHYFEDRYFQITEVDPVGGEYSKEASDALDGMIAAAPFKSAPNLMKAMLLVVQAMDHGAETRDFNNTLIVEATERFGFALAAIDMPSYWVSVTEQWKQTCGQIANSTQHRDAAQNLRELSREDHPLQRAAAIALEVLEAGPRSEL